MADAGKHAVLAKRVASGAALAAVVIAAITLLPQAGRAAFFLLLALFAAYEWAKLAGVAQPPLRLACVAVTAGLLVGLWLLPMAVNAVLAVAVVFWLGALAIVLAYPASAGLVRAPAFVLPAGAVALAGAWLALTTLPAGVALWLLATVAAADTGAYFAGRRFGRRPLAPRASPGKTWAGTGGGAFAALLCGAVGAWWFAGPLVAWLSLAAALFVASVVGDLFESVLKRVRGVKDSGAVLPGHGGVLDRLDSVLGAAPVTAVLHGLL